MPIILEHLTSPTQEDWQDLEKISQGIPSQPALLQAEFENKLNQNFWIAAGRFNDRLVGFILAQKIDNQILLSQASVLKISQGRGVMHQLIALLMQWADKQMLELSIKDVPDDLQKSLEARGFKQQENQSWVRLNQTQQHQ